MRKRVISNAKLMSNFKTMTFIHFAFNLCGFLVCPKFPDTCGVGDVAIILFGFVAECRKNMIFCAILGILLLMILIFG